MKKLVITGGNGDIAKAINEAVKDEYLVLTPGKKLLDVLDLHKLYHYFEMKKPDILINNAGYICPSSIIESYIFDWRRHLEINLLGAFSCSKVAIKYGCETIINIGSTSGTKGKANWSGYCASKAGLISLTESISAEGTKCVCVSPGRTRTKMRKRLFPDEDPNTLMLPSEFAVVVKRVLSEIDRFDGMNIVVKKEGSVVRPFFYEKVKRYVDEEF